MAKELNEDYGFKISIKTLVGIAIAITTVVSFWFAQQAQINELRTEIEEAKRTTKTKHIQNRVRTKR